MTQHTHNGHDPMVIRLKAPGAARDQQSAPPAPPQADFTEAPMPPRKQRMPRRRYPKTLLLGAVALLILGALGYYVLQSQTTISEPTPAAHDPLPLQQETSQVTPVDTTATVAKVARHMLLPASEIPTIAAVSDLEPLKGQEFFRNAEVGDVVLMFAKSRRAILYSPKQDKIIEVAPITTDMQKP